MHSLGRLRSGDLADDGGVELGIVLLHIAGAILLRNFSVMGGGRRVELSANESVRELHSCLRHSGMHPTSPEAEEPSLLSSVPPGRICLAALFHRAASQSSSHTDSKPLLRSAKISVRVPGNACLVYVGEHFRRADKSMPLSAVGFQHRATERMPKAPDAPQDAPKSLRNVRLVTSVQICGNRHCR